MYSKPANQTPISADNFKVAPMPEKILWYMNDLADNKPVSFDEEAIGNLCRR